MTVYCCFTHRFDSSFGEWPKLEAVFTDESKAREWIETLRKSGDFVRAWHGHWWNYIWSRGGDVVRQAYIEKRETS